MMTRGEALCWIALWGGLAIYLLIYWRPGRNGIRPVPRRQGPAEPAIKERP